MANVTCTNGNRKNGINGGRITIRDNAGNIVDQFVVPKRNAVKYCLETPNGVYGKRYAAAIAKAG